MRVPIGYGISYHDARVNWKYQSEPDPGINGRRMYFPRGRVVGGSSSINALIYHRGQAKDYDDWASAGNPGWDYESVSRVYDSFEQVSKIDDEVDISPTCPRLSVTDATASYHPLTHRFADMCEQMQLPVSRNPVMEGNSAGPYFITTRHGTRCSSAVAFLHPATNRSNLTLVTNITVQQIGLKGRRATSVDCLYQGRELTFNAGREVLLAAGAINSPQLFSRIGVRSSFVYNGFPFASSKTEVLLQQEEVKSGEPNIVECIFADGQLLVQDGKRYPSDSFTILAGQSEFGVYDPKLDETLYLYLERRDVERYA